MKVSLAQKLKSLIGLENPYFRSLVQSASVLLGGSILGSLLRLCSLAVAARTLGAGAFGILMLIQTYVVVVDRLFNFQFWKTLIKYGAELLEQKRNEDLKALIRFGTILDVVSAATGTVLAVLGVVLVGRWQGWSSETISMAGIYSFVILFHLSGTPTGILRLLDRFGLLAMLNVVSAAVRLSLVCVAAWCRWGLWEFLFVWGLADVVGQLLLLSMGWVALARSGIRQVFPGPVRGVSKRHPGLWKYVWSTNAETGVRLISREIDLFLVSALLTIEAAGFYSIIKHISSLLTRLADPFYQASLPTLSRLWHRDERETIISYIRRTRIAGFVCGLGLLGGYLLWGRWIITWGLGDEYAVVFGPAAIALASTALWLSLFAYSSALAAMGLAHKVLQITIVGSLLSLFLQFTLTPRFGLVGASLSYASAHILWAFAAPAVAHTHLQRRSV